MSFLAKFLIDGDEHKVIEFDVRLSQDRDLNGKPSAITRGGEVRLVLESTKSTDFMNWMISNTQTKDGSIIFYRRDTMSKLKELKFTKGYCVEYHENFRAFDETPMKIDMTISAKNISFEAAVLTKNWPLEV